MCYSANKEICMRNFSIGLLVLIAVVLGSACNSNTRARQFGGTTTVQLPPGKKLVTATWKEGNDLWYVLRDAKQDEKPETLEFVESSAWGMLNGKVILVEQAK